jgi:hypothetical protein
VKSPAGDSDYLGYFFLAVAQYRLYRVTDETSLLREGYNNLEFAEDLLNGELLKKKAPEAEATKGRSPILYYRGLVLLAQDKRGEARKKLEEVAELRKEEKLGGAAQEVADAIKKAEKARPSSLSFEAPLVGPLRVEGNLTIGNFYDSNVILLGKHTALPRGIVQKHDYRFGLEAGVDVSRQFTHADGIPGESLLVGIGGQTWHLWQPSIGEFNINTYGGRAYVNWEVIPKLSVGVQYDYAYTKLGYEPFISSNRLTPVISKVWMRPGGPDAPEEELARTDLFYSYDYRSYLDKLRDCRFDRDGAYHTIGLTQSFNLVRADTLWPTYYQGAPPRDGRDNERWLKLWLGYRYRNESTVGDEFDLYGHSIPAGVEVPLPYRLSFEFTTDLGWDNYWQASLLDFSRQERFDFVQQYGLGLTRTLVDRGEVKSLPTLQVRLRGGVDLTIQDSNVWDRLHEEVYSYDRAIYSVKLMVNF